MKKPFDIEYTVQIWQGGDQYVAHAMPLDVMSSGATPSKARTALDEAVKLFLFTAEDMGTIDKFSVNSTSITTGRTLRINR
jgi:predicted RNase H-like HicB family nuclease